MTQEETENIQKRPSNVRGVQKEVLYTGKRVQREIQYVRVHNHRTGEFHHDSIALKTYRKTAKTDWSIDEKASISLSENHEGELSKAVNFIQRCRSTTNTQPSLTALTEGNLKERILNLMNTPSEVLNHSLDVLKVGYYRQGLKAFYKLLKQPQQSAADMHNFIQQQAWLLQQADKTRYQPEASLPANTLGYTDSLLGKHHLFVLADYTKSQQLFELNTSCSAWVPTAALNSFIGETTYELAQLDLPVQVVLVIGDISKDSEQKSALNIFNRHQQIQVVSYSEILARASEYLKHIQEYLKQV